MEEDLIDASGVIRQKGGSRADGGDDLSVRADRTAVQFARMQKAWQEGRDETGAEIISVALPGKLRAKTSFLFGLAPMTPSEQSKTTTLPSLAEGERIVTVEMGVAPFVLTSAICTVLERVSADVNVKIAVAVGGERLVSLAM